MKSDVANGLRHGEIRTRRRRGGANKIYPSVRAPLTRYLMQILGDLMALLLLVAAGAAAVIGASHYAAVLLFIVVTNYAVVTVSYIKAQRILEEMTDFAYPNAKVMRNGQLYVVSHEELVQGDIILLGAGDVVPADCRLIEEDELWLLEAGLTGKTKSVRKFADFTSLKNLAPDAQQNMLFASTVVTRGRGRAVVVGIGANTLICRLGKNTPIIRHDKLTVVTNVRKLSALMSLSMVLMIFGMVGLSLIRGGDMGITGVFISSLSLAVGAMPEMLVVFTYIIVACGILMSRRQRRTNNGYGRAFEKSFSSGAVIKNSAKLNKIRDIDCLVIPKESLYSRDDLVVQRIFADNDFHTALGVQHSHGYIRVLRWGLISTGLYGSTRLVTRASTANVEYTAEEECLINAAKQAGIYNRNLDPEFTLIDHVGVQGNSSFETSMVRHDGDCVVAIRGIAEQVLARCSHFSLNGRIFPLTPVERNAFLLKSHTMERANLRVLAVATKTSIYNDLQAIAKAQNDLTFEGFIGVTEPLIPECAKNVQRCRERGIKVIMLCDTTSERNFFMAQALGIVADRKECITASSLETMGENMIRTNVPLYNMYEGLAPSQMRYIVRSLRVDFGHTVGVLGCDLSHMSLLKEADVGFSEVLSATNTIMQPKSAAFRKQGSDLPILTGVSRGGSEALKFGADVVVSRATSTGEGGFNAVVGAINTASNIYRNIVRAGKYLAVSQVTRFLMLLWMVLANQELLSPVHLLFSGMIVDFFAVIVIAFSPKPSPNAPHSKMRLSASRWRNALRENAYLGGFALLWTILTALTVGVMQSSGLLEEAQVASAAFISFIITQFVLLTQIMRQDKSGRINNVHLLSLLLLTAFVYFGLTTDMGETFGIISIPPNAWWGVAIPPLVLFAAFEVHGRFKEKIIGLLNRKST